MSNFPLIRKLNHYRKQLILIYRGCNEPLLETILSSASFYVQEEINYDGWDGGQYGHGLTLYVKDDLFSQIGGFDKIKEISDRIQSDLNQASASITDESIDTVNIELFDSSDANCMAATQPNEIPTIDGNTTSFWQAGCLKLFISHRDTHKVPVSELAEHLAPYGISCFIAHEDIEPTEEWRNEIEKALRSMDAFLSFLTDDFSDSCWTDQEVGFAIARGIPIIPLKMPNLDPYGFMGIYQGLRGDLERMPQTAHEVYNVLIQKMDGSGKIKRATMTSFINSNSYFTSDEAFQRLKQIPSFTVDEINELVSGFNRNDQLYGCILVNRGDGFFSFIQARSGGAYKKEGNKIVFDEDEIPF